MKYTDPNQLSLFPDYFGEDENHLLVEGETEVGVKNYPIMDPESPFQFSREETFDIRDSFVNFYKELDTIQDYFLERKKEKIVDIDHTKYMNSMFSDYTIEPKDMEFDIEVMTGTEFNPIVQIVTSLPLESQIGRQISLAIKERNSGKYVGFVRVASPVLTIKPRNNYFGETLQATEVNRHMINGAIIVPVQPFGFNYLGGKLLAAIACSHKVRRMLKEKYGEKIEPCFFETTSLYGDMKGVSQYDGMKPLIRYQDMTESNLFLFPTEEVYAPIRTRMRHFYGKEEWRGNIIDPIPSGPKMREFNKAISILKNHLKHYDEDSYKEFLDFTKTSMKAKTKKRYYYSNFGFDNVKEHINSGGEIPLREGQNFHKHEIEYIFDWWKKKAQKRYEKLRVGGRLRNEIEVSTEESINNNVVDMVR
jgi:hypothetical protein